VEALFDHERPVVVGFIVERPRLLWLFDRKDRYLALDRTKASRERVTIAEDAGAWDKAAASRLGIDWETTVVWSGMPVRTKSGASLGVVRDGVFDPETGELESVALSAGATADLAVGVRTLGCEVVRGYRDGFILVDDSAAELETSGGAAAAAGKGAAVARAQAEQAAKAAAAAGKTAAAYGKAAAKVAAQSETGKKAMSWLKSVRDEIADAMGDDDEDK
jgi:uncharacterized protein YrrD